MDTRWAVYVLRLALGAIFGASHPFTDKLLGESHCFTNNNDMKSEVKTGVETEENRVNTG